MNNEVQRYWALCQRLKSMHTDAGRTMVLCIEIPTFLIEATNPRVIRNLNQLLETKHEQSA